MGNYKSLSNPHQPSTIIIAELNSGAAAALLNANNKKPTHHSVINTTRLNLARHLRLLNSHHRCAESATTNTKENRATPTSTSAAVTTDQVDNFALPQQILIRATRNNNQSNTDPEYITISEAGQNGETTSRPVENFYESTSEILDTKTGGVACGKLSDNYFSIYDDHFNMIYDSPGNQPTPNHHMAAAATGNQIYFDNNYTIHTIIVKSNSIDNLYSEVNIPNKKSDSNKPGVSQQPGCKSATLAKTGVNLGKFMSGRKYNLHSITRLLQKLTRIGGGKNGQAHHRVTIKIPPKSFDPSQEFYFDVAQCAGNNNSKSSKRPNPPTILPPPLPTNTNCSNTSNEEDNEEDDDTDDTSDTSPDQVDFMTGHRQHLPRGTNKNDLNNNKGAVNNDGMTNEDNYQSVPEYDYISQSVAGTTVTAGGDILMIDDVSVAPQPPPASTQPSRGAANHTASSSQFYSSIEPFKLNNQVYYSFTSSAASSGITETTTTSGVDGCGSAVKLSPNETDSDNVEVNLSSSSSGSRHSTCSSGSNRVVAS
jgi:hypothetical protein